MSHQLILVWRPKKQAPYLNAMMRDLLKAPVRADLVVHVSPVDRAIDGRLVTATALVLPHGTGMPKSISGRDDIVPDTVDIVCSLALDSAPKVYVWPKF